MPVCLTVPAVAGAQHKERDFSFFLSWDEGGGAQKHLHVEHMIKQPVNACTDGNNLRVVLRLCK